MTTQTKTKHNPAWQKIVMLGFLLYIAIGFPLNYVHETGHYLFCDGPKSMGLTKWGGYTTCRAPPTLIFNMAGGIFGAAVSGAIAYLGLRKRWFWLAAPALSWTVDQAIKIGLEGFYPQLYDSGRIDYITTIIQFGSLGLFMYILIRREARPKTVAQADPI